MKFQFRSNAEKIKALAHRWAPAHKKRITRLANFGKFWPKMLVPVFLSLSGKLLKVAGILGANLSQKLPRDSANNPENLAKM